MQGALLCTDAEWWSFHVCIRRKVVISFAFVRTATSIPAASPQQWEWDHLRCWQITKCLRLSNQLQAAENCSCVWGGSSKSWLGSESLAVSSRPCKSLESDTAQMDGDFCSTRERFWLHFAGFSLFSVSEQSLQWVNLLGGCARTFNIWIMEIILLEAVGFQICHGSGMGHTS